MTKIEKLVQMKEEYQKACETVGKEGIVEYLQDFFKANPEITAVKWTQYTPYFNDGDACQFSLHGVYFQLTEEAAEKLGLDAEGGGDYSDGFFSAWDIAYTDKGKKFGAALKAACGDVEGSLGDLEDLLETAFGDHMEIEVSADGKVEVNEYSHD